jgi:hypothetical protein
MLVEMFHLREYALGTDSTISSAIRCELSILPRSARSESAVDDLYALMVAESIRLNVCQGGFRAARPIHALDVVPYP